MKAMEEIVEFLGEFCGDKVAGVEAELPDIAEGGLGFRPLEKKNEAFLMKVAFQLLSRNGSRLWKGLGVIWSDLRNNVEARLWKEIHKYRRQPQIRMFLWLACCDKLMTNEERVRRQYSADTSCPFCMNLNESISHVLRECSSACVVWYSLIKVDKLDEFMQLDIRDWVIANLTDLHTLRWWKVNMDSSRLPRSGSSACGGVIRDCNGRWICRFTKAIGQCSILEAELWGVHLGWSGVNSLVLYIQEALQSLWEVVEQYVPRSGNMVANQLAKLAHHASFEVVVLEQPPLECAEAL
ncbi:hypothetical protein GQ457_05G026390 [Hibiscus cannabinus]